ncbi:MAG TPA: DUF1015 family protein [Vicinamibacterales bacterium]|jgi:uncharacterized protein (DUF1015 family)|nr:DUF1015 family protein [Vicinamibacterales bacterium]
MSALFPFQALRPAPDAAARVASVPYDVVTVDEARALSAGNPLSFLHVTRSEIDLPAGTNLYDAAVYARAADNLRRLTADAPLIVESVPALYCYRLRMGRHEQTGMAGCFAVDEYDRGLIKKHERTRRDKEDDRTRHITTVGAQTGLVLLTYRARADVDAIVARVAAGLALYDFVAPDDVQHTVWRVPDGDVAALVDAFGAIDALYIADGHHRAASASRVREARGGAGESSRFVAVAFPDVAMQVLPYNRVVADLAGRTPDAFVQAVSAVARVSDGGPAPSRAGEASMFLAGRWHRVELPATAPGTPRADAFDVAILQERVLAPILGIADPRTDRRIDFVGGIRGTAELERLVSSGRAAVAFSMHPVGVGDLMAIADEGGIMPPKSTWFEPKLRDGLLVHTI